MRLMKKTTKQLQGLNKIIEKYEEEIYLKNKTIK